jgi:hypothetical protein
MVSYSIFSVVGVFLPQPTEHKASKIPKYIDTPEALDDVAGYQTARTETIAEKYT